MRQHRIIMFVAGSCLIALALALLQTPDSAPRGGWLVLIAALVFIATFAITAYLTGMPLAGILAIIGGLLLIGGRTLGDLLLTRGAWGWALSLGVALDATGLALFVIGFFLAIRGAIRRRRQRPPEAH